MLTGYLQVLAIRRVQLLELLNDIGGDTSNWADLERMCAIADRYEVLTGRMGSAIADLLAELERERREERLKKRRLADRRRRLIKKADGDTTVGDAGSALDALGGGRHAREVSEVHDAA
jgi:hypothetical protein